MTAGKRGSTRSRKLLRSVAVACSVLMVLLSLQTAVSQHETLAVEQDSVAVLMLNRGMTLDR